ncbi:MAG: NACHT domain-containing protein [Candidatus Dormibacteraeota bacterium]|nr:NACHT domain-containing protein [Candidatus Dormibacteraeota bacterium]
MDRLRLVITAVAGACAVIGGVASLLGQLPAPLRVGGSVATVIAVCGLLLPQLERLLKQVLDLISKKEQQLSQDDVEQDSALNALAQRSRRDLLEQVRRNWVERELESSLKGMAPLELRLLQRPADVDNPLHDRLQRFDEPAGGQPAGPGVVETYWDVGAQLLILGEPGAGKTTQLLELTEHLLDRATDAAEPMPVVFQLSTWAIARLPIAEWLVEELRKVYGVPRPLGRYWVNHDALVPLLDGLDEVTPEHRIACLSAINDFHAGHGQQPIVVSSRSGEYRGLEGGRLQLRGAVEIQPLTRSDVEDYLQKVGPALAGLQSLLRDDEQLWELLTTPLFLSIMALAYQGKPASAIPGGQTLEQRRRFILDDYVETMLKRSPPAEKAARYSDEQVRDWLVNLALLLLSRGQTTLYVDWMQPDWLASRFQRRLVTVGVAAAAAVICALANIVVTILFTLFGASVTVRGYDPGQAGNVLVLALDAAFFGVVVGLASYQSGITPTDRLRWSWKELGHNLPGLLRAGFLGGAALGVVAGLIIGLTIGSNLIGLALLILSGVTSWGLLGALVTGAGFGPITALQPQLRPSPTGPGQGMRASRRNGMVGGFVAAALGGVAGGLVGGVVTLAETSTGLIAAGPSGLILAAVNGLNLGLHLAIVFGLIAWFRRGGGAYLRHVALRTLLTRDRAIPADLVGFLEYAANLVLLRRRGGGYEFVHGLLLQHFASLDERTHKSEQSDASQGLSLTMR